MLDTLARSFLLVTNEYIIVGILALGYMAGGRGLFGRTLLLLLFTMQLNPFLKAIFEVPLHPSLNKEGFGFPSGHFQSAAVLWLWLAWECRRRVVWLLASVFLLGCGWALVHFDYHYPVDVWAALGFAILTCVIFEWVLRLWVRQRGRLLLLGIIMWFITIPMFVWTYSALPHPTYLWLSQGALCGFVLGWWVSSGRYGRQEHLPFRLMRLVLGVLGIVLLYGLFAWLKPFLGTPLFLSLHYAVIVFWVLAGADMRRKPLSR